MKRNLDLVQRVTKPHRENTSMRIVAQLRKAYKPARPHRFCPRCQRKTEVDGDGVARCKCGWHAGMTLELPPKVAIVDPAAELRRKP